jgi:hydroxyethylthiazole kinase-like uncharacterized protein yjeF
MGSVLLTSSQMSQADALTADAGWPTFELMRRAGRAVADVAARMAPEGQILIVAGRGNNGGDGLIAAVELAAQSRDVALMLLCRRESLTGDAAEAASLWGGLLLPFDPAHIGKPELIVDALFGAGLNRPIKGDPLRMIAAINAAGRPVLSVDLPSGVNADTGAVMGEAIRATETVTFFRRKPGHLLLPGRLHCGQTDVVQIGIADDVIPSIAPQTFVNDPALWAQTFPIPRIDGHKYSRGHALVVSGGAESTGAARLAARAALRAGAGLVTVASPDDALAINAAALTAVMVRRMNSPAALGAMLADKRLNALVIGPGAGVSKQTRDMVHIALAAERGLVLDADALTSFAEKPDELFSAIKASASRVVMTPHQGEFDRLFSQLDQQDKMPSKLASTRSAARQAMAVVVLKGPDTVVASPDGRAAIADNAPPWLATAGSGDVLSGIIAGLLAQGVAAFEAGCIGVWLHGEAGREAGPGLIAEDLPDALASVLRRYYNGIQGYF